MDDGVRWMLDAMVRCVRCEWKKKSFFFPEKENDVGSWKSVVRGT